MEAAQELTSDRGRGRMTAAGPHWLVSVVLGVALIVLGATVTGSFVLSSLAAALAVGVLIPVCGVADMVGVAWAWSWGGFFLHLVSGIPGIVVGIFFLRAPVAGV